MTSKEINIEQHEAILREGEAMDFIKAVFGVEHALITDLTEIADFSYSGMTPEQSQQFKLLDGKDMVKYWDKIILDKIEQLYGVKLTTPCISIFTVLDLIEKAKNPTIH